jgi:hypothetical protein
MSSPGGGSLFSGHRGDVVSKLKPSPGRFAIHMQLDTIERGHLRIITPQDPVRGIQQMFEKIVQVHDVSSRPKEEHRQ